MGDVHIVLGARAKFWVVTTPRTEKHPPSLKMRGFSHNEEKGVSLRA